MRTSMTRRRLLTLIGGILLLGTATFWRLQRVDPPLPPIFDGEGEAHSDPDNVHVLTGTTMGTTYTVKYVPPHAGVIGLSEVAVEAALTEVNRQMSTYDDTSELSLLNQLEEKKPVPISQELFQVLALSARVTKDTHGAFDITVRPLLQAYGFGSGALPEVPAEEELKRIRQRVGMHLITLDEKARTLQKEAPGVEMDLSAVAKGFGVDQVALALEKLGIVDYLVEVGGEIRVRGEKIPGVPWTLAIEEPLVGERKLHATLALAPEGGALATSGDYRTFRTAAGQIISHTLDPRSGRPVPRRTASVSVIRKHAAEADALATALGVLAPTEAIELANQKGWAVYLLVHKDGGGFTPHKSRAFNSIKFTRHHTDSIVEN